MHKAFYSVGAPHVGGIRQGCNILRVSIVWTFFLGFLVGSFGPLWLSLLDLVVVRISPAKTKTATPHVQTKEGCRHDRGQGCLLGVQEQKRGGETFPDFLEV